MSENDCWDAEKWASDFKNVTARIRKFGDPFARTELRMMRIDVFMHTMALAARFAMTWGCHAIVERMQRESRVYRDEFFVDKYEAHAEPTRVEVREQDCLLAARELTEEGFSVAVLNLASRQNPGGCVLRGLGAQEENLFRRTNLFQAMFQFAPYAEQYGLRKSRAQYPLDCNFGGVYVPDAVVLRGLESDGYPVLEKEKQFLVSFIAVPALNRPDLTPDFSRLVPEHAEATKRKIRTIFRIGIRNGHNALVLGAFGCGVYKNPPGHMAQLFREVLEEREFENKFRRIVFAIVEDHNSRQAHNPEGNFLPFLREFSPKS